MVFSCRMCGECCSSMGEVVAIREATGPHSFGIRFTTTGEERDVTVDEDKRDLFRIPQVPDKLHNPCPFLRHRAPGKAVCTVHATRPDLCRQYACFRILVLDPAGNRIGRVADRSRCFTTMDPVLRKVWQEEVAGISIPDEPVWEAQVGEILTRAGYRVVR